MILSAFPLQPSALCCSTVGGAVDAAKRIEATTVFACIMKNVDVALKGMKIFEVTMTGL